MGAPWGIDWERLTEVRIIDLANPMQRGMPVSPNHPAFQLALMRRHGDMVRPDGGSAANEIIVTGGHVGTHVDALAHVSQDGLLHGGRDAKALQSQNGFSELGIDTVEPIICRGMLLDVARLHGVPVLPPAHEITNEELDAAEKQAGVPVRQGDAVLIRTGWSMHWSDPERFVGLQGGAPGPGISAAQWLIDREARITGAETIAYEVIPRGAGHRNLPVHRMLLVESGIHIIEVMNLSSLVEANANEFLFILAPLKLVGATGSPVRPLAVVDE